MKGRRLVDRALQWHYALGDFMSATFAWTALYAYRKVEIERVWTSYLDDWIFDSKFVVKNT